jgi:osmoprotectant transport system permease protein
MTCPRLLLLLVVGALLLGIGRPPATAQDTTAAALTVGSKKFTENVILAEMGAQVLRSEGYAVTHREQLGGSRFLWNALRTGDIDAYPEYTGTILQELLAGEDVPVAGLSDALADRGLRMTAPLGFNNTYALGMTAARADRLGIRTISDLLDHPDLRLGFSNEFMDRGDGWPGLRARYDLPQDDVRGLDHDLAYRGLDGGTIDVIDLYSTDAEIDYYDLRVLRDDLGYFPDYRAVYLYRADLAERAPDAVAALEGLSGQIPDSTMTRLNARAKIDRVPEAQVAASFLEDRFGVGDGTAVTQTMADRLGQRTREHLVLVGISLLAAILVAIPLGIAAAKSTTLEQPILGVVGVIYTIPSLALLVFMIPLLGIGGPPAMVALFLYSLLPIVRNTHAGLTDIAPALTESARALGLPAGARLRHVELPLAARSILAGIQTSAVINVGTATLGALIGAGGYGQPILTGIRLDDVGFILEGAVPAALLALLAQGLFVGVERLVVSEGLRLSEAA